MFVKRSVKLWWLASGIMAILFAASALMDYLRHFYNQAAAGSAPYWAYLAGQESGTGVQPKTDRTRSGRKGQTRSIR